jgi:hypothetical protein
MYKSKKSVPSAETELISMLFTPGMSPDEVFPWDCTDVEAESYYATQESQFSLEDWSDDELTKSSNSFFSKLNACWPDNSADLMASLTQKFAARIPQQWLEKVAAEAKKAVTEQFTAANQLVNCVQNLLPNLDEGDLLVIARPYIYAMRCGDTTLDSLAGTTDWEQMSATEQAKLTMLVSKYALEQLTQD